MNPRAGRFSGAGRNALSVPGVQIHQIDLEERIPWFTFALKNHAATVGTEVALSCTATFKRQLPSAVNKPAFESDRFVRGRFRDVGDGRLGRRGLPRDRQRCDNGARQN